MSFQTISNDNASFRFDNKSFRFLVLNSEIEELLAGEQIISKDIGNFLEAGINGDVIVFQITWLQSNGKHVKGEIEYFELDCQKFSDFWQSNQKSLKTLNTVSKKQTRLNVISIEKLRLVIKKNKKLRKKFTKKLSRLTSMCFDSIELMSDFGTYDFYWRGIENGKPSMNGGLIFHKDLQDPENLAKGKYSIHT